MLFLIFTFLTVKSSSLSELEQENQELRISNEIMHKQLMELSKLSNTSSLIQEDFTYNKEKLSALLSEYSEETQEYIKITLAEQIQYYLNIIQEDITILGGMAEGISVNEIEKSNKYSKPLRCCLNNFFNW